MIPKVIHYCWFGRNPLPESALKCIESWKKYLPDYEIKEWNEDNFDVNIIPYTAEAYKLKKYAFVSDYARFWILYKYGGLYFDTDVEVIKPMDDIIARGPFMGCENNAQPGATPKNIGLNSGLGLGVNPGLGLGVHPGLELYGEILDLYKTLHFLNPNGTYNKKTVVNYTTETLCNHGLINSNKIQECLGVYIYPKEYFCPKDFTTNKLKLTDKSVCIHHFEGSWLSEEARFSNEFSYTHFTFLPLKVRGSISKMYAAYKFRGVAGFFQQVRRSFKTLIFGENS